MHGAITLQRQISSMNYGFWIINARCIVRMSYFRKLLYNRWHKGSLKGHGSTKSEAVAAVLTDDPGPWCGWKLMKDRRGPQHRIAAACRRSGFCAACDPGLTKQSHSCWTRWRQAGVHRRKLPPNSGGSWPFPPLPSPLLPSPSLSSLPLSFPPSLSLSLEVGPQIQLGGLGSAVSSPSGVWGGAPAEIEFGAF